MPTARRPDRLFWLSLAIAMIAAASPVAAAPVKLGVRVIHAHKKTTSIDPKLKDLAKDFAALGFSAYELKDEATFNLETETTGRMQLPSGVWMMVKPLEIGADGRLRLEMRIEQMKFKTVVIVGKGGTVAIGGPPYDDGALIFAVTRPGSE